MNRINEHGTKNVDLQAKDKQILQALQHNGRMPITQLAKKVGLGKDSVRYRLKKLEEVKVISSYAVHVNQEVYGKSVHTVLLQVVNHVKEKEFIEHLQKNPCVTNIISYSDKWDFEVEFIAKTIAEFDLLLQSLYSQFPGLISNAEILMNVKEFHPNKPAYSGKYVPDQKDEKLMNLLSHDGRKTVASMATKMNLTAEGVTYRLKRLVKEGIISVDPIINVSALGLEFYTILVRLKGYGPQDEIQIRKLLTRPQVIDIRRTLGAYDIVIHVATQESEEYHKFIRGLKDHFAHFRDYDTLMAYQELKFNPFLH